MFICQTYLEIRKDMLNSELDLKKGEMYSKTELNEKGMVFIKETTIAMFYRRDNKVFIFDAKPAKCKRHKFLTYAEDQ